MKNESDVSCVGKKYLGKQLSLVEAKRNEDTAGYPIEFRKNEDEVKVGNEVAFSNLHPRASDNETTKIDERNAQL